MQHSGITLECMNYKHFTVEEREAIQLGLWHKESIRSIAQRLGRSPSSVSREITRNLPPQKRRYTPRLAHERAVNKRSSRGREERLKMIVSAGMSSLVSRNAGHRNRLPVALRKILVKPSPMKPSTSSSMPTSTVAATGGSNLVKKICVRTCAVEGNAASHPAAGVASGS